MKRSKSVAFVFLVAAVFTLGSLPAFGAGPSAQMARLRAVLKEARKTHPQLSVAQAKRLIATEKNLLLIDVREPAELRAGKIAGSVNIPRGVLEFKLVGKVKDPDRPILLYCRAGARAALAGRALKGLGYRNVKTLAGGFLAWAVAEEKAKGHMVTQ